MTEYYADELPGSDDIRWVLEMAEACAYEMEAVAEGVCDYLLDRGIAGVFVTTIEIRIGE